MGCHARMCLVNLICIIWQSSSLLQAVVKLSPAMLLIYLPLGDFRASSNPKSVILKITPSPSIPSCGELKILQCLVPVEDLLIHSLKMKNYCYFQMFPQNSKKRFLPNYHSPVMASSFQDISTVGSFRSNVRWRAGAKNGSYFICKDHSCRVLKRKIKLTCWSECILVLQWVEYLFSNQMQAV